MTATNRKYLVVVRAGDRSLHPQWLDTNTRNWDILVSTYAARPERYIDQYDFLHCFLGSKWEGLSDVLETHTNLIAKYDYIWFPDDDLLTTGANINKFFQTTSCLGWAITQPALTDNSYSSWQITIQDHE
jgi:hypothetical protein